MSQSPRLEGRVTRPGSSWADVLFAIVIRRVLERRNRVSHVYHGTASEALILVGSSHTVPVEEIVWADDLAAMRVCDDNRRLASSMALEVGCTGRCLFGTGLDVVLWATEDCLDGFASRRWVARCQTPLVWPSRLRG